MKDFGKIIENFRVQGECISCERYGSGHINDTYKLTFDKGFDYILQRINHGIFPDVEHLMQNIERVTDHIRYKTVEERGVFDRDSLTIVPTLDNQNYYRDSEGDYWRIYVFIDGASTVDFVTSTSQAYEAAKAFATFQKTLADLPGGPLFESIPDFHNTPKRFEKFLASLQADKLNRAALAKKEIDFALSRKDKIADVMNGLANGTIPLRVTHNDTKINNVMLDDVTGKGVCVIDLDTVMSGSVLFDFGDEVRTTTATAAEDERDLSKVKVRLDLFEALVRGYREVADDFLVPAERNYLAQSGALITFEIGLRFLTDFLDGDVYFKVHRDGHNLDRCRTQFEMVRQMDEQMETLEKIASL